MDRKLVFIDAALVYGENFSLSRLLKLADLRCRDIACFSKADSTELKPFTTPLLYPISLDSESACPRLLKSKPSGDLHEHWIVPLHILSLEKLVSLISPASLRGVEQALEKLYLHLDQHALYGLEAPCPWSPALWLESMRKLHQSAELPEQHLPERFKCASDWDHSMVIKPHPVYATSSQQIGRKKPCQHELQTIWAGIQGDLAGFGSAKGKNSSLKTCLRTSKVHHSMDGW